MPNKEILNLKEATEFLGFKDVNFTRRKCRNKEIPCRLLGGEYRFSRTALGIWCAGIDMNNFYEKLEKEMLDKTVALLV